MEKDFFRWHELKSRLDGIKTEVFFKEREIWWCAVGRNVGVEINGKSQAFARPVLVFKKLTHYCFVGFPLTSKQKEGSWYVPIIHKGIAYRVVLSQIKIFDSKRLYNKEFTLDPESWTTIKKSFLKLFG